MTDIKTEDMEKEISDEEERLEKTIKREFENEKNRKCLNCGKVGFIYVNTGLCEDCQWDEDSGHLR